MTRRLQSAHRNRRTSCLALGKFVREHSEKQKFSHSDTLGFSSKMWQRGVIGYLIMSIKFIPQNVFLSDFIGAECAAVL